MHATKSIAPSEPMRTHDVGRFGMLSGSYRQNRRRVNAIKEAGPLPRKERPLCWEEDLGLWIDKTKRGVERVDESPELGCKLLSLVGRVLVHRD